MSGDEQANREEWRLGADPAERHDIVDERPRVAAQLDHSRERLERPIVVITAEGLAWLAIAVYAAASRFLMLGLKPLTAIEARNALIGLDSLHLAAVSNAQALLAGGWIDALEAGVFGALGPTDPTARILFALAGLGLVMIAAGLRPWLGRAGALGFATLLALSPSVTYFSRAAVAEAPALLAVLTVIVLFLAIRRRPGPGRAGALGFAIGLALSAHPGNFAVGAIFVVALASIGIWQALTLDNAWVRARIWWERRARLVILTCAVAVAVWFLLATDLLSQPFLSALSDGMKSNWARAADGAQSSLNLYIPSFAFYEFLTLSCAILGAIAVLALRVRSRFATFAIIWAVLSAAFFLLSPALAPPRILYILVPAAMLAGVGLDWLHHSRAWWLVRYPIGVLAILTLYVQIMTNFIFPAPNPGEAPWARHALLFWSGPTTTLQVPESCATAAEKAVGTQKTAYFAADFPVLRWYLREFSPTDHPESAHLIVGANQPPTSWQDGRREKFEMDERWTPDLRGLSFGTAVRYLLTARTWIALGSDDATILVRSAQTSPPTTIYLAPVPAPASTTPAAPLAASTPSSSQASTLPAPSPTATTRPSPEPTPGTT